MSSFGKHPQKSNGHAWHLAREASRNFSRPPFELWSLGRIVRAVNLAAPFPQGDLRSAPDPRSLKDKTPAISDEGFRRWWAHQDLNLGPKDYAYHYSFHCLFPVCSLDCLLSLRPTRTVSTPSKHYCLAWLGITTLLHRGFPEFE